MRFSWSNTGLALAVFAGVISWVYAVYRFSSQPEGLAGHEWTLFSLGAGALCLMAAWVADERPIVAKGMLALVGVSRLAFAFFFGLFGTSLVAVAQELVPALLALAAAVLINRIEDPAFP